MSKQHDRYIMWGLTLMAMAFCMFVFPFAATLFAQGAASAPEAATGVPVTQTTTPVLLGFAGIVVYFLEKVKNSKLVPFIDKHTDTLTKIVAAIAAGLVSFGITYTWDPTVGRLTFEGLPTSVDQGWSMFLSWFGQYWLQKAWYVLGIKPNKMLAAVAGTERAVT